MLTLDVALLPSLVSPESLRDQTVIVVDVLRATTTISTALAHGCQYILPHGSIEAAHQRFQQLESDPRTAGLARLGGERGGRIVEGFHCGNSPVEYTPDVIQGKILVLTTTNGTVAMEHCRLARRVLIGSLVNLGALVEQVRSDPAVTVLCSGTDRLITSEDVLFAGALADRLLEVRREAGQRPTQLTDPAQLARHHWHVVQRQVEGGALLADFLANARGGLNLARIGHRADIEFAARVDAVPVVGQLDLEQWRIDATGEAPSHRRPAEKVIS